MEVTRFLGRQMRHIKEGNKYIGMFTSAGAFIGVVGIYFELTWWQFLLIALPASVTIDWFIGYESKKTQAKSERMSAEFRDVEYFRTLEKDVKEIKEMVK